MHVLLEPFLSLTVGHAFYAVITPLTIVKRWTRPRGRDEDEERPPLRASRLRHIKPSIRPITPIASS
jgi:hypothetical protein